MRDEIQLGDEQIAEKFGEMGLDISMDDLVFTRDTIDDFRLARRYYKEPGRLSSTHTTHVVKNLQVVKARPLQNLYVIDFGKVRACFNILARGSRANENV